MIQFFFLSPYILLATLIGLRCSHLQPHVRTGFYVNIMILCVVPQCGMVDRAEEAAGREVETQNAYRIDSSVHVRVLNLFSIRTLT